MKMIILLFLLMGIVGCSSQYKKSLCLEREFGITPDNICFYDTGGSKALIRLKDGSVYMLELNEITNNLICSKKCIFAPLSISSTNNSLKEVILEK